MNDVFYRYFQQACSESQEAHAFEEAKHNPKYREWQRRKDQLSAEIKTHLGDHKRLLNQFEAVSNQCGCMDWSWICEQCFRDCFFLLKWMGVFSKAE